MNSRFKTSRPVLENSPVDYLLYWLTNRVIIFIVKTLSKHITRCFMPKDAGLFP